MNTVFKLALELSRATEWEVRNDLQTHASTILVWGVTEKEVKKLQQIADLVVPAPHKYDILDMGFREADNE